MSSDVLMCEPSLKGEEFFTQLRKKSSKKVFCSIFEFIKTVTEEVSQEQAFYVLDLADIIWKVQLWKQKLPAIRPFFAVKANCDPVLIQLFVLLGFSFDCSTKGEIDLILKNGGKPENIIYAHTVKPPSSLKYAAEKGVNFMTFDSIEELQKIKNYFPNAKLVLRIAVETPALSYNLNKKYGCPIDKVKNLLIIAKDLNLNLVGTSFHVGALCGEPSVYTKAIEDCRSVFDEAQKLGFHFTILNIGSGFFGSNLREKYFHVVTSEIKKAVNNFFPEKDIEVIAEPGCYFVGSAQRHVTCVLGTKSVDNTYKEYAANNIQRLYYLNDGYYGSFFNHIEIYDITPMPLLESKELCKRRILKSKLWGQTCCSEDVIQSECMLPELETGEYIVWENMGSYTQGVCTTFTMVPLPAIRHVFIKNSRLQLDCIKNISAISDFLIENTYLIEDTSFP